MNQVNTKISVIEHDSSSSITGVTWLLLTNIRTSGSLSHVLETNSLLSIVGFFVLLVYAVSFSISSLSWSEFEMRK